MNEIEQLAYKLKLSHIKNDYKISIRKQWIKMQVTKNFKNNIKK